MKCNRKRCGHNKTDHRGKDAKLGHCLYPNCNCHMFSGREKWRLGLIEDKIGNVAKLRAFLENYDNDYIRLQNIPKNIKLDKNTILLQLKLAGFDACGYRRVFRRMRFPPFKQ